MTFNDNFMMGGIQFHDGGTLPYQCGHCGLSVAGIVLAQQTQIPVKWLMCPSCKKASVSNEKIISPAPLAGEDVAGLPDLTQNAYLEVRRAFSAGCYAACEIMCRKILMHVAVEFGAPERDSFTHYIDYMVNKGHISINMREWVDKIKKNGNAATHEILPSDIKRAFATLTFTTILLKSMYESKFLLDYQNKL